MFDVGWRMGLEIELLAPPGKSRLDLAQAIAQAQNGRVERIFHAQSEPSKRPGHPVFHNLTLGFIVKDSQGRRIASCVDDLTLQSDLDRSAPSHPGWYRIVSDDLRLLRLVAKQSDPSCDIGNVLDPIAELFGTLPQRSSAGMVKVNDASGASIAVAATLPGERERPCELITPPYETAHGDEIDELLALVRSLQFTAPLEGAIHLHFDAEVLKSADAIANLVTFLLLYGDAIKSLVRTNPHCRRLGSWPSGIKGTVADPEFRTLSWPQACERLKRLNLSKFCDFNLLNCLDELAPQCTFEVRVLPVTLETQPILATASLFAAILRKAVSSEGPMVGDPEASATSLLDRLELPTEEKAYWQRWMDGSPASGPR